MRTRHASDPFHRILFWTGTHYRDAWLRDVGLCIYLGHDGEPCPNNPVLEEILLTHQFSPQNIQNTESPTFHINDISVPFHDDEDPDDPLVAMEQAELDHDDTLSECDSENIPDLTLDDVAREIGPEPNATQTDHSKQNARAKSRAKLPTHDCLGNRIMTFVHSNGIHGLGVQFCKCPETHLDQRHLHLLESGFYPATQTNPSTVFTLSGLDYALIDNLECKTVPNAYSKKLRRLTDEHDPGTVPVYL
jgi:CxC2 like cysteine cluster associated with KDZ transposases